MLIIDFFQIVCFAAAIALIAVVYKEILLREPVLHWWLKFGERYEGKWFFLPIWGCHMCIAGQLALWFFIFTQINASYLISFWGTINNFTSAVHFVSCGAYFCLRALFAVCAAILFSDRLKTEFDKWN